VKDIEKRSRRDQKSMGFFLREVKEDALSYPGKYHVHMSTCTSWTFGFLKMFKTMLFYVFKNYGIKYVDRFRHKECSQKVPLKILCILGDIKKTNL
jgi:hypothetical protein